MFYINDMSAMGYLYVRRDEAIAANDGEFFYEVSFGKNIPVRRA
jgi:hypothetical protein